jgi:hypothetical protein
MSTTPVLAPTDLQPGDVLLHMGKGELSRLIAWVGDSQYSHAAMVYDDLQLIEAATVGVRLAPLAQRVQMVAAFDWIDVYRPSRLNAADHDPLLAALRAASMVYLGRPYPMTSLLVLGVTCAVRNKLPGGRDLRRVLRMALDLVIRNDPDQVVCSELVYRGFDEATTTPAHELRLPVITRALQHTPFPAIDLQALATECLEDYRRSGGKPPATGDAIKDADFTLEQNLRGTPALDEPDDLQEMLLRARGQLALSAPHASAAANHDRLALPEPLPNPKTVLPADLEFSPGLHCVGRLGMTAG